MNNDQKAARRLATVIAVPLAFVTGFVAFQILKPAPAPEQTPRSISTAPVEIPVRNLGDRQAIVCRAFLSKLPGQMRDLPRRQVTGGHEQNAAYGDPALKLACGGAFPSFAPTDIVYPINGVCWHASASGDVWTTVDREVPVTLTLPTDQAGAGSGQWAAAFSTVVSASIPSAATKPTGCP